MYLKSLVLKGFKSFADRSVLNMEPGLTCIVGPNGSGKSNISDAILWVLGERSPKNLRGSTMEDVIFAGSKGRKAVNVAEVTLVLDNSDGQIPVEYTEIELTRRMYRTGGSDYLINGAPARLLDFLNILHDTGLGTGTHSIISQGNLEAILQSKPEDRRALIEEAAGVLKHKQRKEQSARKLEYMDAHLARVRDIYAEVSRQVGPLERKAKRALTYQELSEEYAGLKLALAVDDVRVLQRSWDDVEAAREVLETHSAELKVSLDAAEEELDALSAQLEAESRNREAAMQVRARAASIAARLDSCVTMLAQSRANAESRIAEEATSSTAVAAELSRIDGELSRLLDVRAKAESDAAAAQTAREEAGVRQTAAAEAANAAQARFDTLNRDRREAEEELTRVQKRLSVARTEFDSDDHQLAFIENRIREAVRGMEELRGSEASAQDAYALAAQAVADARKADEEAGLRAAHLSARLDELEARRSELASQAAMLDAEAKALAEIERTRDASAGEARAWARGEGAALAGNAAALSALLRVDDGYDAAVERALGDELAALVPGAGADIAALAETLASKNLHGDLEMLVQGVPAADAHAWTAAHGGLALGDMVHAGSSYAGMIKALLGDVVVVGTLREALAAHAACEEALRFVTREGDLVRANGIVVIGGRSDEAGVLARKRRMEACGAELEETRVALRECEERKVLAVSALDEARASSLDCARKVAEAEGRLRAAQAQVETASAAVKTAAAELDAYIALRTTLATKHDQAMPAIRQMEARSEELGTKLDALRAGLAEAETLASETRSQTLALKEELSERISALSTAQSTLALAKSRLMDRTAARRDLESRRDASLLSAGRKTIAVGRLDGVGETLRQIQARLDSFTGLAMDEDSPQTGGLADRTNAARQKARELRASYEEASSKLADNRVETAQLKLRVQAAIDVITRECNTSVDAALRLPELEGREEAQARADVLKRRIANLGTVSPEAADEYRAVKKRYDFLGMQLSDLEQARAALKKIDAVIDSRMRTDFVDTFAVVNANFREVFETLFPGGSAKLVLVDPDDIENTGVEVVAQPRGKRITKMMLMSGGEKSLTALALLFAVYKTRTTPFYVLDEVEAALDDTNLRRLLAYLDELRASTQLIMITHQRRTMESADVLFGVSMQNDGVTKVISQRLERALAYAE